MAQKVEKGSSAAKQEKTPSSTVPVKRKQIKLQVQ
jgi:hypothetical protein